MRLSISMMQTESRKELNLVDCLRLLIVSHYQEVGIDRAAAEWVLRCGGGITWTGGVEVENMSGTKYFETKSLLS